MSRSPDRHPVPDVRLVDVDETVLGQLLDLAKRDASPDEVAPPLGGPGWNPERTAWFFSYHRAASHGLAGAAGEKTWAIMAGGCLAGAIRLKLAAEHNTAETGIWLGRSFRARGIGGAALRLVLAEARHAGMTRVTARTLAGNLGAQGLLAGAGAILTDDDDGTVRAELIL
jgi:[ribosomal protein S5]-alanine N-acetyltransferase